MVSRAASGDVAGLETVETAGVVLAMHDDVVWIEAAVAAAAEVLFKGLGRKGPLRWWLSIIDAGRRGWHGGKAPVVSTQNFLPFL
jgi:hypothetical protein